MDGLLLVTPYYNKPSQAGVRAHFEAIASSTDVPVMLYDIPYLTAVTALPETVCRIAEDGSIFAIKAS